MKDECLERERYFDRLYYNVDKLKGILNCCDEAYNENILFSAENYRKLAKIIAKDLCFTIDELGKLL